MDTYLAERIENITERDFWSALKPAAALRPAITAGLAGRRAEAYHLLGQYHARTLEPERELFREEHPAPTADAADGLRQEAERVLRHDIPGWGTGRRQFGPVIDFNADFGQSGQYGFHYLGWLHALWQYYVVSGEPRYRDGFLAIIRQYYEQRNRLTWRIPQLHPVFYELGASCKTGLLLPAYALLAGDEAVDADSREALLKLLLGFARSLHRLQQGGYRQGNWQITGATHLYSLGAAFAEFREAAAWRRRAEARLDEHRQQDFFADGAHSERCWGYGWLSLNGLLRHYEIGRRRGLLAAGRRAVWVRFLKNGFRWFAAASGPGGMMLNYGDGGIGSADGIFATARRVFPELARAPGVLGVRTDESAILRPSGYAFMRGGDGKEAPFLSLNFGRWGGWHTHQDLLDFTLWAYGEPVIEEVGRFGSYDNPLEPMFRSEAAHNQIVLDCVPMDRRAHEARDVGWHSSAAVDLFSAWHEAFGRARVQRQVFFIKPHYWLIADVVTGKELIFQVTNCLHAPRPFATLGPGRFRVAGSPSCLVLEAQPDELRRVQTGVDYDRTDYPGASPAYLVERHRLFLSKWRDVADPRPITFATLLLPFRGSEEPPVVELTMVPVTGDASGQATAYRVTSNGREDLLVSNPAGAAVRVAGRRVTARMAVRLIKRWHQLP